MRVETIPCDKALEIDSLDLGSLPEESRHNLWLNLIDDALGRPYRLPVCIIKGAKPGPVFGISAAVHGNEINGIPVIHELIRTTNPKTLSGVIVALVVANTPAYMAGRRTFVTGADLNRSMPGCKNGSMEQAYAYAIMKKFIKRLDYLVDLHTASAGRINTLYVRADVNDSLSANMARLQNPQIIVHSPTADNTLRGAAMAKGIPSITVEIGNPGRFQKAFIRNAINGINNILSSLEMIPPRESTFTQEPVICKKSYWLYTQAGGILHVLPELGEPIEEGQFIAEVTSMFAESKQKYFAPESGIVVGKSINPVAEAGARILHIGIIE